ncbi:M20/M25/M40 family metallo-hydrolase [Streptomyces decoyicus]|uniref:M20/M25/M40 family metallo-hydrolase n=1 Tax=Streptomyces decoyicus TaxID=249567 RepID=UPI002E16F84E|nr:M20/M25/M40 family metallo-hydrolase [Streptomyces decoyicus]WSV50096.1 M20/M25/M40 family metallo-hydrolase [Streptomyces decoyicus]
MTLREIATPDPSTRPPAASPAVRRRLPGLLLLAVVALIAVTATVTGTVSLPDPLPADASAKEFSAARAYGHVEEIARAPHPIGSASHDRVRDRLMHELTGLGLVPRTKESVGVDRTPGHAMAARVQNIQATVRGTAPTGRVLVVAHYDSVENGPGATDDAHGVAVLLETIRALRAGPAPRNDITFLFSDGEEAGLMGARAFAASGGPGGADRTVVLNLEARGTSGRTVMFETGAHNGALVPALGDHVPVTTSLAYEVYRLLPNATDFTVFREAGLTGMNFANIGTSANYDTPQDNLANSSRATLQDKGSTVLAATRQLAAADIPAIARGADATYFSLGGLLLRYPGGLVLPLAGLSVAALAAALYVAVRRRAVRGRSVAVAATTVVVPLLAAAAVGWTGWQLMTFFRPHYTGFVFGDPYRPALTALGLAVLTAVAVWIWASVLRRRRGALELGAALTCWLTALAVLTAVLVPGASYLFVWPALAGSAGLVLAARLPDGSAWRDALSALAAVPGAALLVPIAALFFDALGLVLAMVPLLVVALFVAPLVAPFAGRLRGRALVVWTSVAALVGAAGCVAGVARDGVDSRHPAHVSLLYVVDGDRNKARWVSSGYGDHPWLERYVGAGTTPVAVKFPYLKEPDDWRTGPAPLADAPAPELKVLSTRAGSGSRDVVVRLGSAGTASQLMLYADTTGSSGVQGLTVGGDKLPGGRNRPGVKGRWGWGFTYAAPPAEGVELTLRVKGDGPLRLRLLAKSPGFPAGALSGKRPATVTWASWDAGFTLVSRQFTL